MYRWTTYAAAFDSSAPPVFQDASFFQSLICASLLKRKMPLPCAPPMGFMIQKAPAFWFLNSWLGLGPGSGLGSGLLVRGS